MNEWKGATDACACMLTEHFLEGGDAKGALKLIEFVGDNQPMFQGLAATMSTYGQNFATNYFIEFEQYSKEHGVILTDYQAFMNQAIQYLGKPMLFQLYKFISADVKWFMVQVATMVTKRTAWMQKAHDNLCNIGQTPSEYMMWMYDQLVNENHGMFAAIRAADDPDPDTEEAYRVSLVGKLTAWKESLTLRSETGDIESWMWTQVLNFVDGLLDVLSL